MREAKGTLRDRAVWDRLVNDRFQGEQPILSPEESVMAARKLYRHAFGKAFRGEVRLTSGNRYTWVKRERVVVRRGGLALATLKDVLVVNPDKREGTTRGLRSIIHDLSHYAHSRKHPNDAPHSIRQARLERDLAVFALSRDWHKGGLRKPEKAQPVKVEKPKADPVVLRYRRMVARRNKWKRELDRSRRLLAKAEVEVRTYERRHGERLK